VAFLLAAGASPVVSQGVVGYLVDYQTQLQEESEQLDADAEMTSLVEDNSAMEVVGVTVEIGTDVICLSGISILGVIVVAISAACLPVVVQKPKEILSKMS
jgi:hypothetical protein